MVCNCVDGVFMIYQLTTLSPVSTISPVKGVTTFYHTQLEGSVCEITLGKKKQISLYELTDRLALDKVRRFHLSSQRKKEKRKKRIDFEPISQKHRISQ